MADQQYGAVVISQQVLKQLERLDIQVISRLIHDQKVGRLTEQLGQQDPVALAPGQRTQGGSRPLPGEQKVAQIGNDVPRLAIELDEFAPLGNIVHRALIEVKLFPQLIKIRHLQLGTQAHPSFLRFQLPENQLQQRTLAGAIGTDQANTVTAHDDGGKIRDNRFLREAIGHLFQLRHQLAGTLPGADRERGLAL